MASVSAFLGARKCTMLPSVSRASLSTFGKMQKSTLPLPLFSMYYYSTSSAKSLSSSTKLLLSPLTRQQVRSSYQDTNLAEAQLLHQKRNFMRFAKPLCALETFRLHDIGEGIASVEILKLYKKIGDKVEEMEPVMNVQSDKAAVDLTSPFEGELKKIYLKEGDIAKLGDPLFDIMTEDS